MDVDGLKKFCGIFPGKYAVVQYGFIQGTWPVCFYWIWIDLHSFALLGGTSSSAMTVRRCEMPRVLFSPTFARAVVTPGVTFTACRPDSALAHCLSPNHLSMNRTMIIIFELLESSIIRESLHHHLPSCELNIKWCISANFYRTMQGCRHQGGFGGLSLRTLIATLNTWAWSKI